MPCWPLPESVNAAPVAVSCPPVTWMAALSATASSFWGACPDVLENSPPVATMRPPLTRTVSPFSEAKVPPETRRYSSVPAPVS